MAVTEKHLLRIRELQEERSNEPDPVVGPYDEFFPTGARPGSAEKVEVMRDRVEHGLPLWHAGDLNSRGGWQ